jgi:hypothetical protein
MTEYKQQIGDDVFYTLNHLWALVTDYPDIDDLENYWDLKHERKDNSRYSYTNMGYQYNLTADDWHTRGGKEFYNWLQEKFDSLKLPFELGMIKEAWCNEYNENGFQTAHRHGTDVLNPNGGLLTCVIYFDDVPLLEGNEVNGCLYTFMPTPSGYQYYEEIPSKRGRVTVMNGEVWHGAYPTQHQRRCLVVDILYNEKEL